MTDVQTAPTGRVKKATVLLISALIFADVTSAFETIMIYTAVKSLLEEYGNPESIGWLISGYLLVGAGAAAICGRLGDMYGRLPVLVVTLALTAIGSAISLFATSLEFLIIGRAIQGLSGAALPLALGLAREHLPAHLLNMSVALITSAAALGAGLGMIIGGLIVDNLGWRHIFTAGLVMAVISMVLCLLFVPRSARSRSTEKLDIVGGLLFLPAVACVLLGVSSGQRWNWDIRTWGLMSVGFVLLAAWAAFEARHPNPLLDVKLLRNRTIALTNLASFVVAFGILNYTQMFLLLLQQPVWTGVGLGLSATLAALVKAPANFVTMAVAPLWGHLANRWGPSRVMMLGVTAAGFSCGTLLFFYDHFWTVVFMALIGTIGVAAAFASIPTILVRAAPLGRVSETIGMGSVVRSVGMAVGSQVMLTVLGTWTVTDPAKGVAEFPALDSYRLLFVLIIGACIVVFVIASRLPKVIAVSNPEAGEPA